MGQNTSGWVDTTNIGANQNVGNNWNSGNGGYSGSSGYSGLGIGNAMPGYAQPNGSSIQSLIAQQMAANSNATGANLANWNDAKTQMQAVPGQYNALQSTQNAQGLSNQLSQNPLSLSPQILQQMKNQASNQITSQGDNTNQQVMGALSAGGQNDASTIAAMKQQQARVNLGAQQTSNTNLDIAAAKQRTQDLMNAAGVAQKQSAQDIGVPLDAASAVLAHLPQVKPDDLSGLIALMGRQGSGAGGGGMGGGGMPGVAPKAPVALNPIGGSYGDGHGGNMPSQGLWGNGGATGYGNGDFVIPPQKNNAGNWAQ